MEQPIAKAYRKKSYLLSTSASRDSRVRRVRDKHGIVALAVLYESLSRAYAGEGHCLQVTEDTYRGIGAAICEPDEQKIKRVILDLVEEGVFESDLFNGRGLLTTAGFLEDEEPEGAE